MSATSSEIKPASTNSSIGLLGELDILPSLLGLLLGVVLVSFFTVPLCACGTLVPALGLPGPDGPVKGTVRFGCSARTGAFLPDSGKELSLSSISSSRQTRSTSVISRILMFRGSQIILSRKTLTVIKRSLCFLSQG